MVVKTDSPDILKKIVEVKSEEVERLKREAPLELLLERIEWQADPLDFAARLRGSSVKVIAEVKRASPSRGILRENLNPSWLPAQYVKNGAAAISVLTNKDHFQGSLTDLEAAGAVAHTHLVPVLRKEFMFDPYQVHEARAYGADAILLIVSMLDVNTLADLKELAESYGMQCLVEVHDEDEMDTAIEIGAQIIGINNRDLRTFHTTLDVTDRLAHRVPREGILVSESGLRTLEDIERVRRAGASAVLIGDALVSAPDPGAKLRELLT
ncbi:MAG: indole-3-glycerol phosphate synthase TrpC [Dehalococcoidia bacterium]|nr:indole-3-glycerol phosphate synthase TrpC [Dehalococcoidia bacterium]